jgi:hypothetical protein
LQFNNCPFPLLFFQVSDDMWRAYLGGRGYVGGVGEPVSLFYDDLMRVFPEAKVILTTRLPKAWYREVTGFKLLAGKFQIDPTDQGQLDY